MKSRLPSALLAVVALGLPALAQNEAFPNTKEVGRAAVEYDDDAIQAVAAYYYSRRNHDSSWLLIEVALTTERRMVITRDDVSLVMPDGTEIPLATQRRFREDINRTRLILQNSSTQRHGVDTYFNNRRMREPMRFFALPFEGTVQTEFVVDRDRMAWGDLFFESPTGLWEAGEYGLLIQGRQVSARLPITLD